MDQTEGISIVICAKNEIKTLPNLIEKLEEQDYPKKEIIVVDDRSTDGTYDFLLAKKERLKHVRIDHTPDHMNNKKFAITLGIKAATFNKILFMDADCYPESSQWITAMTAGFKKSFVLGFSQYIKQPGLLNAFIRYETQLSGTQYLSMSRLGLPYMGVGRNMGYLKNLFLKVKGFHGYNEVVGGDDDLFINKHANRKNTNIVTDKTALVYSFPETNWIDFFNQKKRHISVSKRYKARDKVILGLFSLSQLGFWTGLILLAIMLYNPIVLIFAYISRVVLLMTNMRLSSVRLGEPINVLLVPILDVLFTVYICVIGSTALFAKKITWN